MSTTEINGNGAINKPGLYRHEKSGAEVIVKQHPKLGSAQANGAVAVGFVYVGPAPIDEPVAKVVEKTPNIAPEHRPDNKSK